MTNELNDFINYRLQRASDTLNDAQLLAENQRWNSSINRDFVSFDKELTLPLINQSEEFIALIRKFLTSTKR